MQQWAEALQHFSAESMEMPPIVKSSQFLKQEAEEIGYEEKEVAKYLKQRQALDREEKAAWRDAQKLYAEERKRADENRMAETEAEKEKRADEIRIQMAKIEADKDHPQRD